ncbi:unnamed protein product [Caenorhabditis nigoni]
MELFILILIFLSKMWSEKKPQSRGGGKNLGSGDASEVILFKHGQSNFICVPHFADRCKSRNGENGSANWQRSPLQCAPRTAYFLYRMPPLRRKKITNN